MEVSYLVRLRENVHTPHSAYRRHKLLPFQLWETAWVQDGWDGGSSRPDLGLMGLLWIASVPRVLSGAQETA